MRIPWFWIAAVLSGVLVMFLRLRLHLNILVAWLVAVNIVTFLLFGADKAAALLKRNRVREATLYLFALIGGSPAALAAQSFFRHKVSKRSFVRIYWLIVALQIAALYVIMYTDMLKETIY